MPDTEPTSTASASGVTTNLIIHRNLNIKPFIKQADANDTAVRWQRYKKDIERQFRFFGITDPETKKDGLLIYGGEDLTDVDEALPDPSDQDGDDAYSTLIRKLDNHFMPKKNKDFARFQLSEMKQQSNERLADYYAKVRDIARKCDYGTYEDDAIRDHLIRTMHNDKIRSKAIRDSLTLDRILSEAALDEQTTEQAGAISKKLDSERNTERIKKIDLGKPRNQAKEPQSRHVCAAGVPEDINETKRVQPWVPRATTAENSTTSHGYASENLKTIAHINTKEDNAPGPTSTLPGVPLRRTAITET